MNGESIVAQLRQQAEKNLDFPAVLEMAVRLIHESNPRFHWTGVYELFSDATLRLGPFIGAPTDHVFIGVGHGVCGSAVAEGRNMNIPDVSKVKNYLACSTETCSELVVLIRSGEKIHGQIDIDSHNLAAFEDPIEGEVQIVADYLAALYDGRQVHDAA